ncbi:MAG: hypothetical protein M1608_08565, partial [Candidatus Omnitrophica bacterium]|nr:hypothetical protein [Candidatus Omnitrophota bacterium]
MPKKPRWTGRLAATIVYALIRTVAATVRFRWRDHSGQFTSAEPRPVIFCIWHNRLALSLILYRKYAKRRQPSRRMAALVSASRDGGILARIL